MRPFGGKARKQNHESLRPKVDNIIPMWMEMSPQGFPESGIRAMWVAVEQNGVVSGEPLAGDASRKAYTRT